jgi:hypothetical protein
MDSCTATDWITAIGTCVAAVAATAAAAIAYTAANTWLKGLRNQRNDECMAAVLHLQARAYACKAAIENRKRFDLSNQWAEWVEKSIWTTYAAAWDRQSEFRAAFFIARSYDPDKFAAELVNEVDTILHDLGAQAKSNVPDERSLERILSDLNKVVEQVKGAVTEVRRASVP